MEEIYGNLDNYEEENVIDELKNENKELKFKLEEYASTLSNLQKDFDKLSAEYKKLELNYSSLLKTAKAEIERKTRIITNLNLEKDQLVLTALQKRGSIPPNHYKRNHNKENSQKTEQHIVKGTDAKKLNDEVKLQDPADKIETSTLRNERNNTPDKVSSLDPIPKVSTVKDNETKNKPAEDPNRYRDKNKSETKDVKENREYDAVTEKVKDKVSKIRQRRKSMPLLNRGDFKFSSDEEQEDKIDSVQEHRYRRKSPLREVIDCRYDRDRNDRFSSKDPPSYASEMTRGDNKFPSHRDSVRDLHYKSNSRYHDNDWHRRLDPRDRYDTRSRDHLSTDRYRYNTRKDYSNDQSHRTDYGRHRVTVSSPPEKHKSFYRSRDVDRHRYQNEEAYGYKHKLHDMTEAPSHKRLRTESPKRQPDEHVKLQHDGHVPFQTASIPQIPYSSLQSPEYSAFDHLPIHKVKEIKGTATTKLDDPRLKSNKYVLNKHKDKFMLSTIVGRNVELKCIDKDLWGVELQKMPTPLREKPQISEDYVSQIYMDINNPLTNLSLESGEVESEDVDDLMLTNLGNDDKQLNAIKTNEGIVNILNVKHDQSEFSKFQGQNESKVTKTQSETSDNAQRKWRIPLLSKPNPKPLEDLTAYPRNDDKTETSIRQCHKKNNQEEKRGLDKIKHLEDNPSKLNSNRHSSRNKTKGQLPELGFDKPYVGKPIISVKDTVEDDLELSDETSDCTEFAEQTRYSKEKSEECPREPVIVKIPKDKLKEHVPDVASNQQGVFQQELENLCKNKNVDIFKLNTNAQPKELIKQKESKPNKDTRHINEDIKAKLCDLFGDSSSLITPDDLGFGQPAVNPIANKYSPLFDNTQDAVDLNVEEMEKVQTRSSKIKLDETGANSSNQHDVKHDKKQKSKSNKTNTERKKKLKNIPENTPATEPYRENVKEVLSDDPNVVKTVIISTGIQNSCQTEEPMCDKGQEIIQNTLPLPNLKALATSTPHKILLDKETEQSLPITESTCTASNMSTNSNDIKGNTENSNVSKTSQNDLDVPEFRIVVKRRRKARAPN